MVITIMKKKNNSNENINQKINYEDNSYNNSNNNITDNEIIRSDTVVKKKRITKLEEMLPLKKNIIFMKQLLNTQKN